MEHRLGVRWTVGDVTPRGFEALRLSLWGAWRLFGDAADYAVVVRTLAVAEARRRVGAVPAVVAFEPAPSSLPSVLRGRLDATMAAGGGGTLLPLRRFRQQRELALDHDVILWALPRALAAWLDDDRGRCLIAEDVRQCVGPFADVVAAAPRNSGIRGLPADFDLEAAIAAVLAHRPARLVSQRDEEGLQVAALSLRAPPLVVATAEVAICSPFPPHQPRVGRAGAQFVGLGAHELGFAYAGRPAHEVRAEHWDGWRPYLYQRVGLPLPSLARPVARSAAAM
jgi:hypothetical protein